MHLSQMYESGLVLVCYFISSSLGSKIDIVLSPKST